MSEQQTSKELFNLEKLIESFEAMAAHADKLRLTEATSIDKQTVAALRAFAHERRELEIIKATFGDENWRELTAFQIHERMSSIMLELTQLRMRAAHEPESCRCPAKPGDDCSLTDAECRQRTVWNGPTHICIDNKYHIGAKDRCDRCTTSPPEVDLDLILEQALEGMNAEHDCPALFACAAIVAEFGQERVEAHDAKRIIK